MLSAAPQGTDSTVEKLCSLTLSLCVHADALESQVDRVGEALIRMRSEDEELSELEAQLEHLVARQRKIHAMRHLVTTAENERVRGSQQLRQMNEQTRLSSTKIIQSSKRETKAAQEAKTSSKTIGTARKEGTEGHSATRSVAELDPKEAVRLATQAVVADDSGSDKDGAANAAAERASKRRQKRGEAKSRKGYRDEAATDPERTDDDDAGVDSSSIDEQVERLKQRIAYKDSTSTRSRLAKLEQLKQAVRSCDGDKIVADHINKFKFGADVEALWAAGRCPVIDADTLAGVLQRGVRRYVCRYQDALEVLAQQAAAPYAAGTGTEHNSNTAAVGAVHEDARSLFSCVAYANELAREDSEDALHVRELQRLARSSGSATSLSDTVDWPAALQRCASEARATVSCTAAPSAYCCATSTTGGPPALREMNLLSMHDFCALPGDWPAAVALTGEAARLPENVLPPARHLLTPRFSYADVAEMKALAAARVEVVRRVLRAALPPHELVEDAMVGAKPRDRVVAAARASVAECGGEADRFSWVTILRAGH